MRLFVAVPIPEAVNRQLTDFQRELQAGGVDARWSAPRNRHLTLVFLGEVADDLAGVVGETVIETGAGCAPFMLRAGGLGVFPSVRGARVVWTGISGDTAALTAMQGRLVERLERIEALNYHREKRPFRAHLTLGRFKIAPAPRILVAALGAFDASRHADFRVETVVLYRSELLAGGVRYTRLATGRLTERVVIGES